MYRLKREISLGRFFLLQSLTVIALLLLNHGTLLAEPTGDLKGKVEDTTAGHDLPGANVYLEGTSIGGATDLKGNYLIMGIPAGTYDMVVEYIGYKTQTISIEVVADQMLEQDVKMAYVIEEIGEVITVSAQREGQAAAINSQLTANSVMNVVSGDRLLELPDANVAESIGRVPGVSIEREAGEASKIVIRGLEPKLNAITVNGVQIPATSSGVGDAADRHAVSKDLGDRAVDLSMMSGEFLEAIEVFKAPTPDMNAEAIGGIVNLKVRKAPEERRMLLRVKSGYNQLSDEFSDYKVIGQYSQRFYDNKFGLVAGVNIERFNRGSERFGATYDTDGVVDTLTGIVPIAGQRMNIRDTEEIRKRYGGYITLDYAYDNGTIWLSSFINKTSRNPFSVTKNYRPNDRGIVYDVRYQEIDISGLSNSLYGEHQVWGIDIDWVVARYSTQTNNSYDMDMEFRAAPDWDETILDRKDIATYVPAARDSLNTLYLRNNYFRPDTTSQTDYTAELNFQIPYSFGKSLAGFLKFGGQYRQMNRDRWVYSSGIFDYYQGGTRVSEAQALYPGNLEINGQGRIAGANFLRSTTDSERILDDKYVLFPLFDKNKVTDWYSYQKSLFNGERFTLSDTYDLQEQIAAGYVMAKLNVGQMLSVIPGVRYEHSDNTYNGVWSTIRGPYGANGLAIDTTSSINYGFWFPHLHIKYKPVSWFDLRVSAIKTLARPNYYWVLPWTRIVAENSNIDRGNPDLKATTSWNYELSTSFYSNKMGLFTVGGFYKQMENIIFQKTSHIWNQEDIDRLQIPGGQAGYRMRSYENADKANVWGFEIDLQTQFILIPFMPRFLKGIVLNANYARVWSEAYYPQYSNETITDWTTWPPTVTSDYKEWDRKGPLVGQADQIFNMSLGYDIGGLSARLSFLYQGASKSRIGVIEEEDEWDDDFWRWDASVIYKFNDWIGFNLNFAHITGQPDRTFFGHSEFQTDRYYYGMTATIGVEINYKGGI